MIQPQSIIYFCDSSGIRSVKCVRLLRRKYSKSCGKPGSFFIGSILQCKSRLHSRFKKGSLVLGFFLFSKKENSSSSSGFFLKSIQFNFGVLVERSKNKYTIPFLSKSRCCLSFGCSQLSFLDLNLSDKVLL